MLCGIKSSEVHLARSEILYCRVALDSILLGSASMLSGIKSSEVHLALQLGRRIGPGRRQVLAVAAPGRIELDQPAGLLLHQHLLAEVAVGQLHHVLPLSSAGVGIGRASTSTTS